MDKKPKFIYNDDSDTLRKVPPPHTKEKIGLAVDYLKKTSVDCLVWCVGNVGAAYSYESDKVDSYFGKLKDIDSIHFPKERDLMYSLYMKGIDYLPFLIDLCRKSDLLFFASFRMNDAHLKSSPRGVLASRFWQERQHMRLWEVTDDQSYHNACLDYSYPEVRNMYFTMIEDFADRYDIDGIELDFCRNPYFFNPSEAWDKRSVLTGFVAEIKGLLDRAGGRRGKEISLVTRVPFEEDRLKKAGIDLIEWLAASLPQVLVMSSLSNNYNIKIEPWLKLARENGVLFYPSIEANSAKNNYNNKQMITNPVAPGHNYNPPKTPETVIKKMCGIAQNLLAQNPDGIYTFNYPCILNERENNRYKDPGTFQFLVDPLRSIADSSRLRGMAKKYTYWDRCPISVETGRPAKYHQTIKFLLLDPDVLQEKTDVKLSFIETACKNPHVSAKYRQNPVVPAGKITYRINGRVVSEESIRRTKRPCGRILSGFLVNTHRIVEISVDHGMLICGQNEISFEIPGFPEERDPYIYIHELEVDVSRLR